MNFNDHNASGGGRCLDFKDGSAYQSSGSPPGHGPSDSAPSNAIPPNVIRSAAAAGYDLGRCFDHERGPSFRKCGGQQKRPCCGPGRQPARRVHAERREQESPPCPDPQPHQQPPLQKALLYVTHHTVATASTSAAADCKGQPSFASHAFKQSSAPCQDKRRRLNSLNTEIQCADEFISRQVEETQRKIEALLRHKAQVISRQRLPQEVNTEADKVEKRAKELQLEADKIFCRVGGVPHHHEAKEEYSLPPVVGKFFAVRGIPRKCSASESSLGEGPVPAVSSNDTAVSNTSYPTFASSDPTRVGDDTALAVDSSRKDTEILNANPDVLLSIKEIYQSGVFHSIRDFHTTN